MIRNDYFEKEILMATRDGFGEAIALIADKNENIYALCADLTESTKLDKFRELYRNRFIELGVAEQNMAAVASGIASMGMIPFMASYAMFSPGRNWEQIRTTICYNNVPVKIVGAHGGLSVGPDGATHQALEDVAILNPIPNIEIYVPIDNIQASLITKYISTVKAPCYLRLNREKTNQVLSSNYKYDPNKLDRLYVSKTETLHRVAIIGCGPIMNNAIKAAKILETQGITVAVFNMARIKPLNRSELDIIMHNYKYIVTVEEAQIIGGMGQVISAYAANKGVVRVLNIGVEDRFGQSGKMQELYKEYGLDEESIAYKIFNFIS